MKDVACACCIVDRGAVVVLAWEGEAHVDIVAMLIRLGVRRRGRNDIHEEAFDPARSKVWTECD